MSDRVTMTNDAREVLSSSAPLKKTAFRDGGPPKKHRGPYLSTPGNPKPAIARKIGRAMVAAAPDFLREQYAEPAFLLEFATAIKRDAIGPLCGTCGRGADRTCRHLIHETLGMLGKSEDFAGALARALGVTLEFASSAVRASQGAEALAADPAAMVERAELLLAEHYAGNAAAVARSPLAAYFAQRIEPEGGDR